MKWLINLNTKSAHLYILRLCIVNLLWFDHAFTFKSATPIVRHPGTCTFQQSQAACTFSLLCYLAGGLPVEGCGTADATATCCVLQHTPSVQQMLDYSKLRPAAADSDPKSHNTILQEHHNVQPTIVPQSSITYSDTDQSPPPAGTSKSLSDNSHLDGPPSPTESSLMSINNSNDDSNTLHSSSSSLSASTNPYDSLSGYQTQQIHHSARSLYPPPISHPSSLQYHHRLQHTYSNAAAAANPHHLNHQKQHQQNLYLHHQRLAHHPSLSHHNSLYHSSIYHQPHYQSPYHTPPVPPPPPQASSNARSSFQLTRYNDPLFSQYPSNYLLNDNLNYYAGDSSSPTYNTEPPSLPYGDHLNGYSLNDQTTNTNSYASSLSDLSSPNSHSIVSPNAYNTNNSPQFNEPADSNSPAYLNDYSNPSPTNLPSSVSSPSSLLSSYGPTQTIDYKTYQKHAVSPNSYIPSNDHLQFPPLYSTSSSTSSFESTTNHTANHHLLNSNKIYDGKTPLVDHYSTAAEPPASIKYYNTNLAKTSDYEPPQATNYNSLLNTQPDDHPPAVHSEEDTRLLLDNGRLNEEDEYNSNAIRRSRLASASPLNSITIERQTHARNFIGEDGMRISGHFLHIHNLLINYLSFIFGNHKK